MTRTLFRPGSRRSSGRRQARHWATSRSPSGCCPGSTVLSVPCEHRPRWRVTRMPRELDLERLRARRATRRSGSHGTIPTAAPGDLVQRVVPRPVPGLANHLVGGRKSQSLMPGRWWNPPSGGRRCLRRRSSFGRNQD